MKGKRIFFLEFRSKHLILLITETKLHRVEIKSMSKASAVKQEDAQCKIYS